MRTKRFRSRHFFHADSPGEQRSTLQVNPPPLSKPRATRQAHPSASRCEHVSRITGNPYERGALACILLGLGLGLVGLLVVQLVAFAAAVVLVVIGARRQDQYRR